MEIVWTACGYPVGIDRARIFFSPVRANSCLNSADQAAFRLSLRLRTAAGQIESGTVENLLSSTHQIPSTDAWFNVLDQRRFTVGHKRWTAQVAGIHVVGSDTWIQLEFAEDEQRSLLLQLTPDTGVGAAVEAIENSLRRRDTKD